jgi:hypothetical protein
MRVDLVKRTCTLWNEVVEEYFREHYDTTGRSVSYSPFTGESGEEEEPEKDSVEEPEQDIEKKIQEKKASLAKLEAELQAAKPKNSKGKGEKGKEKEKARQKERIKEEEDVRMKEEEIEESIKKSEKEIEAQFVNNLWAQGRSIGLEDHVIQASCSRIPRRPTVQKWFSRQDLVLQLPHHLLRGRSHPCRLCHLLQKRYAGEWHRHLRLDVMRGRKEGRTAEIETAGRDRGSAEAKEARMHGPLGPHRLLARRAKV